MSDLDRANDTKSNMKPLFSKTEGVRNCVRLPFFCLGKGEERGKELTGGVDCKLRAKNSVWYTRDIGKMPDDFSNEIRSPRNETRPASHQREWQGRSELKERNCNEETRRLGQIKKCTKGRTKLALNLLVLTNSCYKSGRQLSRAVYGLRCCGRNANEGKEECQILRVQRRPEVKTVEGLTVKESIYDRKRR